MEIRRGDFTDEHVLDLLRLHAAGMEANSPPGHCHYLDLSGLQRDDVGFWTIWDGDTLFGCGALKALDADHAEIKSMRTAPAALRRGAGRAMLRHLLDKARRAGHSRVSLETGTGGAFDPALTLYRSHGFVSCDAFGDYAPSAFNQFLTLHLSERACPPSS